MTNRPEYVSDAATPHDDTRPPPTGPDASTPHAGRYNAYLLACRACGDPDDPDDLMVMPFGSAADRGRWATDHTELTGHDSWWVHTATIRGGTR